MKLSRLSLLLIMLVSLLQVSAQHRGERPFFDTSRPSKFLELRAYAQAGGSTVTQNYISCFPEINELNVTMGTAVGAGVGAQFLVRDFLSFGTELNFLVNNYNTDIAVTGADLSSVSSVFLKNRYCTLNIPVFASFRFNVLRGLKWNVDLGAYYTYGLSGRQRQSLYDSRVNDLGQLVMHVNRNRVDYYDGGNAFINSYSRGDIGLHVATGLSFGRHVFVSVKSQIGFKNVVKGYGSVKPDMHNVNILVAAGWRF